MKLSKYIDLSNLHVHKRFAIIPVTLNSGKILWLDWYYTTTKFISSCGQEAIYRAKCSQFEDKDGFDNMCTSENWWKKDIWN